MNDMTAIAVALAAALSISGSASAGQLTAAKLQSEFVGHTFYFQGPTGSGTTDIAAGNSVVTRYEGGQVYLGTWRIQGNRYCTNYRLREPSEVCSAIISLGNGRYRGGAYTLIKR